MAGYISREAARPDAFCSGVSCQECPFCKDIFNGGCRVDDFIMALPAANVQPVVHGHWILDRGDTATCSNCGNEILIRNVPGHLFCNNCGADMREIKDD